MLGSNSKIQFVFEECVFLFKLFMENLFLYKGLSNVRSELEIHLTVFLNPMPLISFNGYICFVAYPAAVVGCRVCQKSAYT